MRQAGKENRAHWTAVFLVLASFPVMALPNVATRGSASQSDSSEAKKVPIYLADFQLSAAPAPRSGPKTATGTSPKKATGSTQAETNPSVQARRIVDAFAVSLADAFQKSGYTATRQTGDLPSEGVLLRGVFAEADQQNRIRRAILGAGSPGPTFLLYVGVFNLARQDQPLYQRVPVRSADARYGPVITLNAYIPMMKFEVPKDPAEEDIRRVCEQIVSQLTTLLVQNPNAVTQ